MDHTIYGHTILEQLFLTTSKELLIEDSPKFCPSGEIQKKE